MPRFSDEPLRWAPQTADPVLSVSIEDGTEPLMLDLRETRTRRVERTHDFHCVTGWSYRDLAWGGVVLQELLQDHLGSGAHDLPPFALAYGADDRHAIFVTEDLVDPSVLVATTLDGEPVPRRHGGAVRLVSPKQYGYKSVKHLTRIEFVHGEPASSLGGKEHLRARIDHEERHATLPNWLIRFPYRLMVVPTALMGDRGLRNSP